MSKQETSQAAAAAIEMWRARGAHRLDPMRFHLLEVFARRSAPHTGDARQRLDNKLKQLLVAYAELVEKTGRAEGAPMANRAKTVNLGPGPLAALVAHAAQQASLLSDAAATSSVTGALASPRDLKSLHYFKSTWSKLSTDRRLAQSLEKLPENAGPLNSHQLVHRSLSLMRELSPAYLGHFMAHVDALLWLDQVSGAHGSLTGVERQRSENQRKRTRNKS